MNMPSVLVRNLGGRYLERIPFDGAFSFLATFHRHATPMTADVAAAFVRFYRAHDIECSVVDDYLERASELLEPPEFVQEWQRMNDEANEEVALAQMIDRR